MGKPRSKGRLDLPENLRVRPRKTVGGTVFYYYWRDPRSGAEVSLRCPNDRNTAIKRTKELNAIVAMERADSIISEISSSSSPAAITPFDAFAVHCLSQFEKRGLAKNTLKTRKSVLNAAIRRFGNTPIHEIGVPEIAQLLKSYVDQGKGRYAQSIRSILIEVWREAHQEGLLPADHPNPASITRRPDAKVKRARLTIEAFHEILNASRELAKRRGEWIPNSILLAVITGQRREDLAIAQFGMGRDWQAAWEALQEGKSHPIHPYPHVDGDFFWVVQQKTGSLVKIPLSLRLEVLGLSVGEAIEKCSSQVSSKYLLHHTRPFGNAPVGSRISIDRISHAFAEARDMTGLSWPGKNPPSFHELRSLSERLYRAEGVDTRALLGHRHAKMTEVYADARQAEWNHVDKL